MNQRKILPLLGLFVLIITSFNILNHISFVKIYATTEDTDVLILLSDNNSGSIKNIIQIIKENNGTVFHVFPPNALIAKISPNLEEILTTNDDVKQISSSIIDPATIEGGDDSTIFAVKSWNTNYMGQGITEQEPSANIVEPGPIIDDVRIAPKGSRNGSFVSSSPPFGAGFWDTSEYLIGDVSVAIIFPESNGDIDPDSERWLTTDTTTCVSEIQAGLGWWAAREPKAGLTFTYHTIVIPTSYEPITRPQSQEGLWIGEVMSEMGYSGDYFTQVASYLNNLRDIDDSDWAVAIFVAHSYWDNDGCFPDDYFAYAYLGGPFMVMTYDNDGYGLGNMDAVTSHEFGHIFYALDEYYNTQQLPTYRSGYLNVDNQNTEYGGGSSNVPCIMRGQVPPYTSGSLCSYTRGQVGLRDQNGDGTLDIIGYYPNVTLNAYLPDPTFDTTPTYTGYASSRDCYPNSNPQGTGNAITINTIFSVSYYVYDSDHNLIRSGSTNPTDGDFDSSYESYYFTIELSLPQGTYQVQVNAWSTPVNWSRIINGEYLSIEYRTLTIGATGDLFTDPPTGTYSYESGSSVQVQAYDGEMWQFDHWILDGENVGNDNPITVTMDKSHTLTAVDNSYLYRYLTVETDDEGGLILVDGSIISGIWLPVDTQLGAEAIPSQGWTFSHWHINGSDIENGYINPYNMTLSQNIDIEAVFKQNYFTTLERTYEYSEYDTIKSFVETSDGGYVLAGSTLVDGVQNAWVLKTDEYGNQIWEKKFLYNDSTSAMAVVQTPDGGYIIAGEVKQTVDEEYANAPNLYLQKLDANGNNIKVKIGTPYTQRTFIGLEPTQDGNYLLSIMTKYIQSVYGGSEIFRIDSNLNYLDSGAFFEFGVICPPSSTNDDGILVTGSFDLLAGGFEGIKKLDNNYNIIWEIDYPRFSINLMAIHTLSDGCIVAGSSNGVGYLLKLDQGGNQLWNRTIEVDDIYLVEPDPTGGFMLIGNKNSQQYLLKTDSKGNLVWDQCFPSSSLYCIKLIINSEYVITGNRATTEDIDGLMLKVKNRFEDGFESGSFMSWTGTSVTSGETVALSNTQRYRGRFSARFTGNGGGGIEGAVLEKVFTPLTEIYSRGYFKVTQNGITDDSDRYYFIVLNSESGANLAYAGWRRTAGALHWCLVIRDGTGYITTYSTSYPVIDEWYCLEVRWVKDSVGLGELYIDGAKVCTALGDTTLYGDATSATYGLTEIFNCGPTTAYADCIQISTSSIGKEPVNADPVIGYVDAWSYPDNYWLQPGGEVSTGRTLRIYTSVSDFETPSSDLVVSISFSQDGVSWTTLPSQYNSEWDYWYVDWVIPGDATAGLYDVRVDASDSSGGFSTVEASDRFGVVVSNADPAVRYVDAWVYPDNYWLPQGGTVPAMKRLRIYAGISDVETPSQSLNVTISYSPDGVSWATLPSQYNSEWDYWYIDWVIPGDATVGLYDVKVEAGDEDGGSATSMSTGKFNVALVNRNPTIDYISSWVYPDNYWLIQGGTVSTGRTLRIYTQVSDADTASKDLTVLISYSSDGEFWTTPQAAYNSEWDYWYVDWVIPSNATAGLYDVRVEAGDGDGGSISSTASDMFNVAFSNADPVIRYVDAWSYPDNHWITPGGDVSTGRTLRIYSGVSDFEAPSANLVVTISFCQNGVTWITLPSQYNSEWDYWYVDWVIPGDATAGLYDVRVEAEDGGGGYVVSTHSDRFKVVT